MNMYKLKDLFSFPLRKQDCRKKRSKEQKTPPSFDEGVFLYMPAKGLEPSTL